MEAGKHGECRRWGRACLWKTVDRACFVQSNLYRAATALVISSHLLLHVRLNTNYTPEIKKTKDKRQTKTSSPSVYRQEQQDTTMGSLVSTMGSKSSKNAVAANPEGKPRYWYRDNFFLTNDKAYLDPHAINAVFESDLMWWNDPLPEGQMRKMISNCMTMSIYHVPESEKQMQSTSFLSPSLSFFLFPVVPVNSSHQSMVTPS